MRFDRRESSTAIVARQRNRAARDFDRLRELASAACRAGRLFEKIADQRA
jgi:hypothetical protein